MSADTTVPHAFPRMSDVLSEAWEQHGPATIVGLFSGGHDSLCATHVAAKWCDERSIPFRVASIDTTTAIPETLRFIERTVATQFWAHDFYKPPVSFREMVLDTERSGNDRPRGGFPGPAMHGKAYARLKERCIRQIMREHKGTVILVSGCRSEESVRRMRHTKRIQVDTRRQIWAAVIHDWTKVDCNAYIRHNGLDRNPVSDVLHRSGECNCGAFANGRDELREMLDWYPEMQWILDLEAEARGLGIKACVWGQAPPDVHDDQMELWGFDESDRQAAEGAQMLCTSCAHRNEAAA